MRILWFTWKDGLHPRAGGAESVNEALAKRLVDDGHHVRFVVAGFEGAPKEDERDGYFITRLGSRWTVYFRAWRHYKKELCGRYDVVIDEINTIPFFAGRYVIEKNLIFVHQLAREVWFREIAFPLSLIGWLFEPLYLRLLRDRIAVTVSESTKKDLMRHGFDGRRITVLPQAVELEPADRHDVFDKFENPTMLAFGEVRSMKRTLDILRAFEIAKKDAPKLELVIAGDCDGPYGNRVARAIIASPYVSDIRFLGRVSEDEKKILLGRSQVLCVASVKEGWGLVVTEAAGQGTPAVVYDVDGLRDSVKHEETGLIVKDGDPAAMASAVLHLLSDPDFYGKVRYRAWTWSRTFTPERSFQAFIETLRRL